MAVLDLDYHHGNGTQQLFYERSDVLYVSLHGDPVRAWPYFSGHADETGAGVGEGPRGTSLPAGCSDEPYIAALDEALELIARHGAPRLVASVGFDTYRLDAEDLELTNAASTRSAGESLREVVPPSCCKKVATTCRTSAVTRGNGSAGPRSLVRAGSGRALRGAAGCGINQRS